MATRAGFEEEIFRLLALQLRGFLIRPRVPRLRRYVGVSNRDAGATRRWVKRPAITSSPLALAAVTAAGSRQPSRPPIVQQYAKVCVWTVFIVAVFPRQELNVFGGMGD